MCTCAEWQSVRVCVCVDMCSVCVWACAECVQCVCMCVLWDKVTGFTNIPATKTSSVHLWGQTHSSTLCVCVVYESIVWMHVCCASVYACLWHSGTLLKHTPAKVGHFRSARTSFKDGMSPSHVYTKVKVCYQSTTSQKRGIRATQNPHAGTESG